MDKLIRMKDNPGAVVNIDNKALAAYKLRKQKVKQQEDDINNLKTDMQEIKHLLKILIERSV